jgi:hypothetical protein
VAYKQPNGTPTDMSNSAKSGIKRLWQTVLMLAIETTKSTTNGTLTDITRVPIVA